MQSVSTSEVLRERWVVVVGVNSMNEHVFACRDASGLDLDWWRTNQQTTEDRREPSTSSATLSEFFGHGWSKYVDGWWMHRSFSFLRRNLVFGNRTCDQSLSSLSTGISPKDRTSSKSLPRFRSIDITASRDSFVSSYGSTDYVLGDGQCTDEHPSSACDYLF